MEIRENLKIRGTREKKMGERDRISEELEKGLREEADVWPEKREMPEVGERKKEEREGAW